MNELLAEFLCGYAATNHWLAILPEILMGLLALSLLMVEMWFPGKGSDRTARVAQVALWGQVGILALIVGTYPSAVPDGPLFGGMIAQNEITHWMRGFFVLCALSVTYFGRIYLSKQTLAHTEFYHLVLIVSAGMMLLVQSANFVMLFVALETVTIAFYILVAYARTDSLSLEAGLKYLVLGAVGSSILLFGIVLLYGVAGNPELAGTSRNALDFSALKTFIAFNPDNLLVRAGSLMVLAGVCFKIGAVPFQIWVPDVYQGAPTPVTAYLAVGSKAAGFLVLLNLIRGPLEPMGHLLVPVLSLIAGATILFGNVAATGQRDLKRLLGLSGIAHAGYLLLGVIAAIKGVSWAPHAVVFYLFAYLFAAFLVFGVMTLAAPQRDALQSLEHYRGFARRRPFLSGVLVVGLGSLAGIPPLGGFIGKFFLFVAAFQAGLFELLAIAVLGVVISINYYFGWLRECYFSRPSDELPADTKQPLALPDRMVLGTLATIVVVVGIYPAVLPVLP